jgi:hypothetical protein
MTEFIPFPAAPAGTESPDGLSLVTTLARAVELRHGHPAGATLAELARLSDESLGRSFSAEDQVQYLASMIATPPRRRDGAAPCSGASS